MAEWLGRELGTLELGVVMIDGIHIDEHVMLVALGIDGDGKKHVLGVREGATENATACTALLADLPDRGLHTDRPVLVVIDAAKALAKAVRNLFGEPSLVVRTSDNITDGRACDAVASCRQVQAQCARRSPTRTTVAMPNAHRQRQPAARARSPCRASRPSRSVDALKNQPPAFASPVKASY